MNGLPVLGNRCTEFAEDAKGQGEGKQRLRTLQDLTSPQPSLLPPAALQEKCPENRSLAFDSKNVNTVGIMKGGSA